MSEAAALPDRTDRLPTPPGPPGEPAVPDRPSEPAERARHAGDERSEATGRSARPAALELRLSVRDPEVCEAVTAHPAGSDRDRFVESALRIGVLALRDAAGRVDADSVRHEGERLMADLTRRLEAHRQTLSEHLSGTLRTYFDPESGRLPERIERLVRRDGELAELLRQKVGADDSELAHTLARHVGEGSPLLAMLAPDAAGGLVATLQDRLAEALAGERERILREFSLDHREGALSRLVSELDERHDLMGRKLDQRIDAVVSEFSLDQEDSALSRLLGRVEHAHERINREFSLDHEGAALARMRKELMTLLEEQRGAAARFQEEVRTALSTLQARREEAARSTRHGDDFEHEVTLFVRGEAHRSGDVASHVGKGTGAIRHCRKGDVLVELGAEAAAAGARIVVEAKEDKSFDLGRALAEVEQARRNREASASLFVFSKQSAPEGLEPLARYGPDVVVVWDADDRASDVFLRAGLSVARALATRAPGSDPERDADLGAIDAAILEIERQAGGLDEIRTAAETARKAAIRIDDRARIVRDGLSSQVVVLTERVGDLRRAERTVE